MANARPHILLPGTYVASTPIAPHAGPVAIPRNPRQPPMTIITVPPHPATVATASSNTAKALGIGALAALIGGFFL